MIETDPSTRRRRFLRLAGTAAIASLAGCGNPAAEEEDEDDGEEEEGGGGEEAEGSETEDPLEGTDGESD